MGYIWNYHFQTPGQRRPEAQEAGVGLVCNDAIGGLTPRTDYTMLFPAESAVRTLWRSRTFTVDPNPTNYIAFGFWVWFHNVDLDAGKNEIKFWEFLRNNVSDVALNLNHFGGNGHQVEVFNAAGATVLTFDNPFTEEAGCFVEVAVDTSTVGSVIVRISPTAGDFVQAGIGGNFRGSADSNTVGRIQHRGQLDLSPDLNSSAMRVGPAYVQQDIAGAGSFLGNGRSSDNPGLEYYGFRHDDATGDAGCRKNGIFPGNDADAGTWNNTGDDDNGTYIRFTGSIAVVGSVKEMAVDPRGGPAPHFRPDDEDWYAIKYNWYISADLGGSYLLGFGSRSNAENYFVDTIPVVARVPFYDKWLLPNVTPGPNLPSELFTFAMGGFIEGETPGKNLDLREMYAGAFGAFGMGGEWPDPSVGKEHHTRGLMRGVMRGVGR